MLEIPNKIFFEEVVRDLQSGKDVTIPMRGVSMLPFLKEGRDSVRIKPIQGDCLKNSDVVLFYHRGLYKLHRFRGVINGQLHMHGDGLFGDGEMCSENDVVAVVTHIIRNSGKTYSTSSWQWKVISSLWIFFKPIVLRLYNRYWRIMR